MVHVQDDVQAVVIGIVHDLLDTGQVVGIDVAGAVHMTVPGDRDTDGVEAVEGHGLDEGLGGDDLTPASLLLLDGLVAPCAAVGRIVPVAVQGVTKVPAGTHVLNELNGRHGVQICCIDSAKE